MVNIFYDSSVDMWAAEHDLLGRIAHSKSIKALVQHIRNVSPQLAEANGIDITAFHDFAMRPDAA